MGRKLPEILSSHLKKRGHTSLKEQYSALKTTTYYTETKTITQPNTEESEIIKVITDTFFDGTKHVRREVHTVKEETLQNNRDVGKTVTGINDLIATNHILLGTKADEVPVKIKGSKMLSAQKLAATASELPKAEVTTNMNFIAECLSAHNKYRNKHKVPPVTVCQELCQVAQSWANTLARKGCMDNSNFGYGENIYWTSSRKGVIMKGSVPVDYWYKKEVKFDWGQRNESSPTGSNTQILWKDSKVIGVAKSSSKKGTFVVVFYTPEEIKEIREILSRRQLMESELCVPSKETLSVVKHCGGMAKIKSVSSEAKFDKKNITRDYNFNQVHPSSNLAPKTSTPSEHPSESQEPDSLPSLVPDINEIMTSSEAFEQNFKNQDVHVNAKESESSARSSLLTPSAMLETADALEAMINANDTNSEDAPPSTTRTKQCSNSQISVQNFTEFQSLHESEATKWDANMNNIVDVQRRKVKKIKISKTALKSKDSESETESDLKDVLPRLNSRHKHKLIKIQLLPKENLVKACEDSKRPSYIDEDYVYKGWVGVPLEHENPPSSKFRRFNRTVVQKISKYWVVLSKCGKTKKSKSSLNNKQKRIPSVTKKYPQIMLDSTAFDERH